MENYTSKGGQSAATLSVMKKGKAKTGGGKRGKVMTLPEIQLAESTYREAVRNCKPGSSIGFKKLGLPPNLKKTAVKGILKELRAGKSAGDIFQQKGESRKWSDSKKKVSDANAKKVKKFLKKDKSAMTNSTRLLAAKVGVGRTTVQTIISKKLQMRPLKHVKVTHNTAAQRSKRKKLAQSILEMYRGGMRTYRIFWSDETWVDQDSRARYNPQNERLYFPKSDKKDEHIEELRKPLRQRTPGIMVHITATSASGGALLKPHFVERGKTMTSDYYCSMLQSDVLPQVAVHVPEGEKFFFQQDLAAAHTATRTMDLLAEEGVSLVPWLPKGADVSPLDIYVNPELKRRLHGKDLGDYAELKNATARTLSEMSNDPVFLEGLVKCCKGIKKRFKWIVANDGRITSHSLAKSRGNDEENK